MPIPICVLRVAIFRLALRRSGFRIQRSRLASAHEYVACCAVDYRSNTSV